MSSTGFLTDEHVPGAFIAVLRSIGFDVLRAKDELEEGASDGQILSFARERERIVITCDMLFTIIDDERVTDHHGVFYADQAGLQRRPEDAAGAVDRVVTTIPDQSIEGNEFYISEWMRDK